MQFNQNATVISADSKEVGHLVRVVIDPDTKELTHIVVRKGTFNVKDKVVPLNMVAAGVPDSIGLRLSAQQVDELSDYEETKYSGAGDGYAEPTMHGAAGYLETPNSPMSAAPATQEKIINIPPNTVALKEGSAVTTADGKHIGKLEQVLTGPESGQVTHVRVSRGVLHKESRLVEAEWIDRIEEKAVTLSVDAAAVDSLPNRDNN